MATRKMAAIKTVIAEAAEITVSEGMKTKVRVAVNKPLTTALRFEGTASSTPTPPRKRKPAPANGPQDRALLAAYCARVEKRAAAGIHADVFRAGYAAGAAGPGEGRT